MKPFQFLDGVGAEVWRLSGGVYNKVTDVEIIIRPLAADVTMLDEGLAKTFKGYVDVEVDVRVGDEIRTASAHYKVKNVGEFRARHMSHKELILDKIKDV